MPLFHRPHDPDPQPGASGDAQAKLFPENSSSGAPLESKPDPAIKALTDRLDKTDQTLESRWQQLNNYLSTQQPERPAPAATANPSLEQLNEQFLQNPLGYTAALIQAQQANFAQQQFAANYERDRESAKDMPRKRDKEFFDRYETEIQQYVQEHWPVPQHQTNPHVWATAADAIRGRHAKEVYEEDVKKRSRAGGGPAEPSLRSQGPNITGGKEPLSDEEKVAAAKLRLNDDDYRKGKDFYQANLRTDDRWGSSMLSSAMAKATYEDDQGMIRPVITFDSDLQRPRRAKRES